MEGIRESLVTHKQITLNIADIGASGEGIAKLNNNTVFIPFALPDEKVEIKIMHRKQNLMFGKLLEILTPSEERIRPRCELFTKCGGCQLQHMKNYNQLKLKTKMVAGCLKKIAKIDMEILPAVKSENIFNYRNKLQLPVGFENNKNVVGFFAHNTHKIVPMERCHLHPEWQYNLTQALKVFMQKNNLNGYDYMNNTASGVVRHLVVREINRRLIITLVLNCEIEQSLVSDFVKCCANIYPNCSIYLNINKENSNVILGDTFIYIYGEKVLGGEALGIKYKCHPNAFFQVNDYIRDKIYQKVLSLIVQDENFENVVVDAYSGIGVLSAYIAK
ncbi:MAG: 23S rRNA (uracil(1939)-C(5))-methyltransferase RlmD, partial [Firmicutes bacterium]|nr:23S rRNA (uracil(1939)-C(5))-methyltransferase RlmD [Bacillota bacterium]